MAEGFGHTMQLKHPNVISRVESAAIEGTSIVNPNAIKSMAEININIEKQFSKGIWDLNPDDFDIVISMCGCGATVPPNWKAGKRFEDWNVDDPSGGDYEGYVVARDEIDSRVIELVDSLIENRKPTYSLYEGDACPFVPFRKPKMISE